MSPTPSLPSDAAVVSAVAGKRSWPARHGAAIAAGATTLILLVGAATFLPRKPLEAPPPAPTHWFDDRAGLVSPGFAAGKSEYLQQYLPLFLHASVLIETEPKTPSGSIEEYTVRAANAWKIGAKGADNGVVLFVFRDERTVRLEVGYGLEGPLPDVEAKHLVEATLLPKFAQGRYEEGFDDFLSGLEERLKAYSDDTARRSNAAGIVEYAWAVLKQTPRLLQAAWAMFLQADITGRFVLAPFGGVFATLFGYGLSGVAIGLAAIVQLPWRIATGGALRTLNRDRLAAEFAPAEFMRRPPPSLVAVADELGLGAIFWGVLSVAGIVIGIAFLGLGTEVFIGERGQFSGAGVTAVWPLR